ncbi:MAG: ABC transporter, partial [Gammaproteobacteria bacterium]|nr:ABC transporter [Gammaproteobacteria bacterium]
MEDRPRAKSVRPLRELYPFIRPYRGHLVLALLALLIAAVAMLVLPVALRYLIDNGFAAENAAAIDRYFLVLLGVTIVFG